jgi:hypothetical protein
MMATTTNSSISVNAGFLEQVAQATRAEPDEREDGRMEHSQTVRENDAKRGTTKASARLHDSRRRNTTVIFVFARRSDFSTKFDE